MHSKENRSINEKSKDEMGMMDGADDENKQDEGEQNQAADEPEKEGGTKDENADASGAGQKGSENQEDKPKEKEEKTPEEKVVHKILIPGISRVYGSYEDAMDHLNFDCESIQENIAHVIIEVDNAKAWTGPKGKKYVHRLFCSLNTHETQTI